MADLFYARVSSKEQNLARQLERAKELGIPEKHVWTDKQSGKNMNRPGFEAMMEFAREGDTIHVLSLDRLSRNYGELLKFMNQLQEKGIAFKADDLPTLDSGDPKMELLFNNMIINLLGWVADNERQKIRERQAQGIKLAKERHVYKGRPAKYSPTSNDPQGRMVYENIKRDYLGGNYGSKMKLAEKYGITRPTLYKILKAIEEEQKTESR